MKMSRQSQPISLNRATRRVIMLVFDITDESPRLVINFSFITIKQGSLLGQRIMESDFNIYRMLIQPSCIYFLCGCT